jgi:hypothetical protein
MAHIYWTNGSGGNFNTASDWNTNTVPGIYDQASISAFGSYNVDISPSASDAVLGLSISLGASLVMETDSELLMTEGTGGGANNGTIILDDGAGLYADGTINNTSFGTIELNSTDDTTELAPEIGPLTLSGQGSVILSDNPSNYLYITTNVANTISGAGNVYLSNNEKYGTIEATGAHLLMVNPDGRTLINAGLIEDLGTGGLALNGTVDNAGLLEAAGSSGLVLSGTVDNSSGGSIEANSGDVELDAVTIIGGTLSGGEFYQGEFDNNSALDGIKAAVNNAATLDIANYYLTLEGTINNTGSIDTYGGDSGGGLFIGQNTTLKGGGSILLQQGLYNQLYVYSDAASATLTNLDNIISGAGFIGGNGLDTLTLINQSKGVIDAQSSGMQGPLIIDTGANAITNGGTLEATTGTLFIDSKVINSGNLNANGGNLVAAGIVTGGKATITGAGVLEFDAASSAATTFAVGSTGQLILYDAAQYTGTVSGFGKNTTQSIDLPNVQYATVSKTYSSGTLTVKDTSGDIAKIKFSGSYTLGSFTLSPDGNDGTVITDPPVASKTSGVNIALLGNYIASSLVGGSVGQGGSLPTDPWAIVSPHMLATPAHA